MPRKAAKGTSTAAAKRPAEQTPPRQSKRARATARKSYAEPDTDDDDEQATKKKAASEDEADVSEASVFDESSEGDPASESELADATSDEDTTSKKATPRGKATKRTLPIHKKQADEKELWKPGAKLTPGTQLIIKKPKARDAGDTPYTDETIHPNTMLFLTDLAANNNRQWLKCRWIYLAFY